MIREDESIIEWDEYGYPTQESLEKLEQILNGNDIRKAIKAFYSALKENYYPDYCGSTEVEVRGKIEKVWEYHTGGWSGNEDIIRVLKTLGFGHLLLNGMTQEDIITLNQ